MSEKRPVTVKTFLVDGTPEGVRAIELSNWTGKATMFARPQLKSIKTREEFKRPGVYVLLGKDDDNSFSSIYIGEGDPIIDRLENHYREKDFWTHAITFTTKDQNLNKAHVQYLESKLHRLAVEAKRFEVKNGNEPDLPSLSESDSAEMEEFLEKMLIVYGTAGVNAFEKAPITNSMLSREESILYLEVAGTMLASGSETNEGFVVFQGSRARKEEAPAIYIGTTKIRADLVKLGVFKEDGDSYLLTQDYLFPSPSAASSSILARSSNGRIDWKRKDGTTLKKIQENGL